MSLSLESLSSSSEVVWLVSTHSLSLHTDWLSEQVSEVVWGEELAEKLGNLIGVLSEWSSWTLGVKLLGKDILSVMLGLVV